MDDPVDALFTLPPSEFTAARNALVKQLHSEKRREEAEAVKALKRPSVPAWALNQVARRDPDAIEGVIEAGAAVGAAQRRALSGVRESGLREASQQRRDRIDAVWQAAADVLREAGTEPAPHRQAVAATLEAASVEPEAAQLVRQGRLSADLPAPSGFGDVAGFALVPQEPATDRPQVSDTGDEEAPEEDDTAAREELAEAQRQLDAANRRAEDLADRAADARRAAVRTADEAERAERRAAQLRRRAEEEAATAADLAQKAEAVQREAEKAAAAVDQARAALAGSASSS